MLQERYSSLHPDDQKTTKTLRLISEFQLNQLHCLVISISLSISDQDIHSHLNTFLNTLGIEQFSEVDRFEINAHRCAIIEIKSGRGEAELDFLKLLTERELQIAALVAQGQPNKQIAKHLHISEWTVATHIRRIFAKLHVDSRAAMVYRCASLIQNCKSVSTDPSV